MKVLNVSITTAWIKNNISLLVLLPTVAGGLWQLLELLSLGTPYIRFFSLTQLVPDGLLIFCS
jgi:hypothetical protein